MVRIVCEPVRRRPWTVQWTDVWCGERKEKSFLLEEEAQAYAVEQERRLVQERAIRRGTRRGEDPRKDRYTVREVLEAYLASLAGSTATRYSGQYHVKIILEMFGKRKAHLITRQDALTFAQVCEVRGLAQATTAQRLGIFRAALGWAENKGMISLNGLLGMRLSRGVSRVYPVPTIEQLQSVMRVAPDHICRIIVLGLYTGCRIGPCELYRLQWEQVDLERRTIFMPASRKNRKAGDVRPVPMRDDLVPALWLWRRQDAERFPGCTHVIHYQGRPVHCVTAAWRKALTAAGVQEYFRPYDLRHGFASMTMAAGEDAASVAKVMGHCNTAMLMKTYLHLTRQLAEKTVNAVPGNLGRLIRID